MDHQSVLHPAGPMAHAIGGLWWWMLGVAAVVYVIVLAAFAYASLRGGRPVLGPEGVAVPPEGAHRTMRRTVSGGILVTLLVLFAFLFYDFGVGRALAEHPAKALTIKVIGHQWWWEIVYNDPDPSRILHTANEIHIPVGVPVQLELSSVDVIHSFWVPNLNGKRDLVPGYTTSTWVQADTAGVYRGQCAEFCGYQHAKMALYVVAQPRQRFEAWLAAQLVATPPPTDSVALAGQKVFLAGPCSNCHTIAGTSAHGTVGPDLSHLGSRLSLGAGTIPNTIGNLAGWIVDPQSIKPGVDMPSNQLEARDLQAIIRYLESLQ